MKKMLRNHIFKYAMGAFMLSFMFLVGPKAEAQINIGLTATASHSGGGATNFDAWNYNDGIIPPFNC